MGTETYIAVKRSNDDETRDANRQHLGAVSSVELSP